MHIPGNLFIAPPYVSDIDSSSSSSFLSCQMSVLKRMMTERGRERRTKQLPALLSCENVQGDSHTTTREGIVSFPLP